jgi:hypothetical protein
MSCSTSRIDRPSSRSWRSTVARPFLLLEAQPGRGLVEQQQGRIGGERAGDLHQALLAEGEVAGLLVHQLAHADALELALGLLHQAALLGAVGAQHRRRNAVAAAQVRAEGDVLEHGHRADHLDVLEGARDAAPRDLARRQRVDPLAEQDHLAARRRQHAGDEVEGGRLAGAVRADQAEDLARADLEADVVDGDQAAEFLAHRAHVEDDLAVRRLGRAGSGAASAQSTLRRRRGSAASTNAQMPSRAYCSMRTSRTPKTMIS